MPCAWFHGGASITEVSNAQPQQSVFPVNLKMSTLPVSWACVIGNLIFLSFIAMGWVSNVQTIFKNYFMQVTVFGIRLSYVQYPVGHRRQWSPRSGDSVGWCVGQSHHGPGWEEI